MSRASRRRRYHARCADRAIAAAENAIASAPGAAPPALPPALPPASSASVRR